MEDELPFQVRGNRKKVEEIVHPIEMVNLWISDKGYVQLALRTGQYKNINVLEIYKGQLKSWNPLTEELEFDFNSKESEDIIGYAAFFKLINGFEKTVYWNKEKVLAHAKRFSKTYNQKEDRFASYNKWKKEWIPSPWETDFNEMAKKTVLKNTLSKWGMLSIEMQTAIQTDQAVIKNEVAEGADINSETIEYPDNQNIQDVEYKESEETSTKLDEKFKKAEGKEESKDDFKGTPFEETEGEK